MEGPILFRALEARIADVPGVLRRLEGAAEVENISIKFNVGVIDGEKAPDCDRHLYFAPVIPAEEGSSTTGASQAKVASRKLHGSLEQEPEPEVCLNYPGRFHLQAEARIAHRGNPHCWRTRCAML
jgi:hypothetical protein